jgi:hypothetical protein
MKRKALSLVVTIALVLSLGLIAAAPVAAAAILTVDTGAPAVHPNYHTIQDAVDAAASGDTIIVSAGTYAGATVDEDVSIVAKEGDIVVINDGPNHPAGFLRVGFWFPDDYSGSGATIRGFSFEGAVQTAYTDDGKLDFPVFSRGANNVTIEGNYMSTSLQAITNWHGSGWLIDGNEIHDLWTLNGGGIGILCGANNASTVANNVITDNIIDGTLAVLPGDGGGYDGTGIVLYADYRYGRLGGIVANNAVIGNEISLVSDTPGTVNVNGIELTDTQGDDLLPSIYSNQVVENDVRDNGGDGIAVSAGTSNNDVNFNRIVGNGGLGVAHSGTNTLNAESNWWGDATGPIHADNPHGGSAAGDAVSDNVGFTPWYATATTTPSTELVAVSHNPVIAVSDTIQGGIDAALAGDTVHVAAGTYNESLDIDKGVAITGDSAATTFVTGGVVIQDGSTGLTLEGLYLTGDGPGPKNAVIDSRPTTVPVADITIRDCVLDGEDVSGRGTFYGHYITGTWTWDGNEIKNFPSWYVIDNTGSQFDPAYKLSHVVFTDNYIHDVAGSTAFRGKMGEEIETAVISGNYIDYSMILAADSENWATIEVNKVLDLQVFDNTVIGVPEASWLGEGQAFQFWSTVPWTVDIHDNTITGNYEGILFVGHVVDGASEYGCYVPSGTVHFNDFAGNDQYGVWLGDPASTPGTPLGGPLDARYNWWGDASGPDHETSWYYAAEDRDITNPDGLGSAVSDNVLYDPWIGQAGMVTGGGWFNSQAGAYAPDPTLVGKATFGFVAKNKKDGTPAGNTEFVFRAVDLNFHSGNYDWLVVNKNASRAQFKGTGTINNAGDYKFMLWAVDGASDAFRIKIWEEVDEDEVVMYDNGFEQPIGGGNIVVHKK